MSRELATLALEWVKQGQKLRVRQRERLRRVLAVTADVMSWQSVSKDGLDKATKDIAKLARSGTRSIRRELDRERETKRSESRSLKTAVKELRKLAESSDSDGPTEFSYSYTARSPSWGLVTKTEELTLADADEATAAADTVEKRSATWDKLRIEMLEELKAKDNRWAELSGSLSDFAQAYRGLVKEVLATVP